MQMDYMFPKSTGECTDKIEDAWSTTLVIVHVGTGFCVATAADRKGVRGVEETLAPELPVNFVVHVVLTFLKRLCLDTVILQTDGEPAIVELAEAVAKLRPKTLARKTPAHSSQSNGAVESCIGHLAGQVRTMRSRIEVMHDVVISPNWCVWAWMARHAAWLASRFSVRASGRTAHEEAFDSE